MAVNGSLVVAVLGPQKSGKTRTLFQFDYGITLRLSGVSLPETYEVHFSNSPAGEAKTAVGGVDGVKIPDEYLTSGEDVHAWLYLHTGEDDGETVYHIVIPVTKRARPTDAPPTPEEQSAITQAIAALNQGVTDAETAASRAEAAAGTVDGVVEQATRQAEMAEEFAVEAADAANRAEYAASHVGPTDLHIDADGHLIYTWSNEGGTTV